MRRFVPALCFVLSVPLCMAASQSTVRVEPMNLQGPRPLNDQTRTAVIRDYLEAWKSMDNAFQQNRADLLNRDFIGVARDKLTDTIHEQARLGISTRYHDRAHDLQIVFYSPEGLSVQLVDNVEYEVQLIDHGKLQATQTMHARYVAVMTPAEVRWRVRIFQSEGE